MRLELNETVWVFSFGSKKGVGHIATVEVETTFAKHTLHLPYIYPIFSSQKS
jgi:hypothetical protein